VRGWQKNLVYRSVMGRARAKPYVGSRGAHRRAIAMGRAGTKRVLRGG
jgi:hypothetical protein